uniref:Uncharacterized protein n=1 Tax=Enterobacter cloacae TaxID=550 RepID=A0A1S6XY85_ENTCL|nr:hypothetical protein [Enterobacter cloacae]AQX35394.1 hypothetical protein PIMI5_00081 [Enterobacter cloacae]
MKGPRIDDRINFLRGIERDWKDWSAGKKPGRVSMKWIGVPISLVAALMVTEILKTDTTLFWIPFIITLLGLPLWIFLLTTPGTWEEKIQKKIRAYEPLDIDAMRTLAVSVFHKDELTREELRQWLDAEFSAISDAALRGGKP